MRLFNSSCIAQRMRIDRAVPTGRYDQQEDASGTLNYWRLYVELTCPSCENVFWANFSVMAMNGKRCPKCGKLLLIPPRRECQDVFVPMPTGGLRAGEDYKRFNKR